MLTAVKALFFRLFVAAVVLMWIGMAFMFLYGFTGFALSFLLPRYFNSVIHFLGFVVACVAVTRWCWPRLAFLRDPKIVNGNKATVGMFCLFVALLAFPGTMVVPVIIASMANNSSLLALSYASFFGLPVFVLLSVIGLALVWACRPPEAVAAQSFEATVPGVAGP